MAILLVLFTIFAQGASAPVGGDEEMKGKLIHPGSSDTFENRKLVKEMLEALNIRTQKLHRAGQGSGPQTTMQPRPDLGPKNNFTKPMSITNQEIAEWMYEGDIVLTPSQAKFIVTGVNDKNTTRSKRACITDPSEFWDPLTPIPYTFDSSLTSDVVALIRQGIQYWTSNTCMSFTLGTVTHEIGHALGFFHTQSRYDRDSWVYVDLNNVPQNLQYNFAKMTPATENHFGQPYDFGSVMQYDPYAFAEDPNQYTVTAINMAYQNSMGQREAPAFSDVRMMNWLYNCSSFCMGVPVPPCRQPGYQDPRNCYSCKCPRAFGGQYCEQLADGSAPNCNGAVVQLRAGLDATKLQVLQNVQTRKLYQATSSSWSTLNGVAGDPNSYTPETDTTDCYWHITAPAGRRIQLRLSTPPSNCMQGCPWQGIEVNLGKFDLYGMIMCCQSSQTYTSVSNLVTIRGIVRYNQLTFGLDYRVV
ncbi:hypothetical protein RB195_013746 [Necator americanus]|uniref:Zinc metalloproteinase n=1 Tax=Necator americanus TaxID=51031 RepID=A0ABR1DXE1_NECAM